MLIVDGFLRDPQLLMRCAADKAQFQRATGYYSGVRAPCPSAYTDIVRNFLSPEILEILAIPHTVELRLSSCFAIVTKRPSELTLQQRIPHFDAPSRSAIAVTHYLFDDHSLGGTRFFRHRQSGYEYVDSHRQEDYFNMLRAELPSDLYDGGDGYIGESNSLFAEIESVAPSLNRAVIYRGSALYSGSIGPEFRFDQSPNTGRLSVTSLMGSTTPCFSTIESKRVETRGKGPFGRNGHGRSCSMKTSSDIDLSIKKSVSRDTILSHMEKLATHR